MDSDHPWFDVEATIRVRMRTEGWSAEDARQRVETNLSLIQYNPVGWDDRELVGEPQIDIHSVEFVPQGYRTEEPGREPQPAPNNSLDQYDRNYLHRRDG